MKKFNILGAMTKLEAISSDGRKTNRHDHCLRTHGRILNIPSGCVGVVVVVVVCVCVCGGGGVLRYFHTCLGPFFWVQNFELQYFWGFSEKLIFLGIKVLWIFLSSQNWTTFRGHFYAF